MKEMCTDTDKFRSDSDLSRMTKDRIMEYFNHRLGIQDDAFTTKVTKIQMINFHDRYRKLVEGFNKYINARGIKAFLETNQFDVTVRRAVVAYGDSENYEYWGHSRIRGISTSRIYLNLVQAFRAKAKDQLVAETVIENSVSVGELDFSSTIASVPHEEQRENFISSSKTATVSSVAVKEPKDALQTAFEYLRKLASDNGAHVTIVFTP